MGPAAASDAAVSALSEKSTLPLSMIFTLLGGAFAIGSAIVGVAWRQDVRASATESTIALIAKDVSDIKAEVVTVKATLIDRVTVNEIEAWIRLQNAINPTHALPRFRN